MKDSSGSCWLAISLSASAIITVLLFLLGRNKQQQAAKKATGRSSLSRLPPGPPGWPMIGNMLELGDMPHRSLFKLKAKYGPVIWLKLGSVNTMVVQSGKAAEELFKNHDLAFSDRKCPEALNVHGFKERSIAMCGYTPYWRYTRKICASELLSSTRLNEMGDQRRQSIDKLIQLVEDEISKGRAELGHGRVETGEVDIGHMIFRFYFALVGNLTLSRDVLNDSESPDFYDAMINFMELATEPNIADFLPFLRWLDPKGIRRSMLREMGRCMKISARFVRERIADRNVGIQKDNKDMLDILLDSQGDQGRDYELTEHDIVIILMEMFLAGSDTTSSSIEWAMAAAMRHPHQRKKLREEIDRVVGLARKVEESDIDNLLYVQAFVKETLRLYVSTPLLPRKAREDTDYMGYLIPKDTQVIVNGWGISRDPDSWDEPEAFKPERFLESDLDYKQGQHYEYLPFGSGRRMCPGVMLAHRTVPLVLANLLQHFDWELTSGVTPETMNMEEKLGLSLRRVEPLRLRAKKRSHVLGN